MKIVWSFLVSGAVLLLFATCKKEYSYEGGPANAVQAPAIFSLQGSPNSCSNIKLAGAYIAGIQVTSGNTLTLMVDVSSAGEYSISTNTANGISFRGSGIFTGTGIQQIILQAAGTPVAKGNYSILISAGSSQCNFTLNVSDPLVTIPVNINLSDSAWQFRQGSKTYRGFFDGALTNLVNGSTIMTLVGLTPTRDTAIAILVDITGSSVVKTGTYSSLTASTFTFFDNKGNSIFTADKTTPNVEIKITVSSYDASTQIVRGIFSGTARDRFNQPTAITEGKFNAKLN